MAARARGSTGSGTSSRCHEHFTIYAADMPGLGDSDPPDDVRDVWSVTHCVETAMKELLPADKTPSPSPASRSAAWWPVISRRCSSRASAASSWSAPAGSRRRASRAEARASFCPRCRPKTLAAEARRNLEILMLHDPAKVDGVAIQHADHEHHARQDAQPRHGTGLQAQRSAAAGEDAVDRHLGRVRFDHLSAHPGTRSTCSVPCSRTSR